MLTNDNMSVCLYSSLPFQDRYRSQCERYQKEKELYLQNIATITSSKKLIVNMMLLGYVCNIESCPPAASLAKLHAVLPSEKKIETTSFSFQKKLLMPPNKTF